jgi:hypothetical protein
VAVGDEKFRIRRSLGLVARRSFGSEKGDQILLLTMSEAAA